MEFEKGERVFLNFETGGVEKTSQDPEPEQEPPVIPAFDFVGDILEHNPSSATPPVAPSPRANTNGFPAHKKRVPRVSAFKQQRAAKEQQQQQQQQQQHVAPPAAKPQNTSVPRARFDPTEERRAIDEENMRRLDTMSEAEIEEERRELMENLSPALLQRLLARSNLDEGSNETSWPDEAPAAPPVLQEEQKEEQQQEKQEGEEPAPKQPLSAKKVSFAAPEPQDELASPHPQTNPEHAYSTADPELATGSLHFPPIPQPPDLDPNDPNFLQAMHSKYFPSLPYNPATLSWMAPVDASDASSPYHPSRTALNASELRFDFKGTLLAPSVARAIPSDRGLHHHADAPEAAGYTIAELAVTARSAVPAQRCMAYQTLGRILYRLGQGEFGQEKARQETDGPVKVAKNPGVDEGGHENEGEGEEEVDESDDVGHYMAAGLWSCIEEGRVIETLTEEANREKGHLTARTFAQEALWNWRRGGGRKRHAV
jgi:hypothetical protein